MKKRVVSVFLCVVLLVAALPVSAMAGAAEGKESAAQAADLILSYSGAVSVSYAMWQDGQVVLEGSAGVYSRTENRALTPDIAYGVGSISKIYTTAAVMRLVEQGKVELDRPVYQYLPEFTMADPRYRNITVRMLLNHSSGLMGSSMGNAFLFADAKETQATDELLTRLRTQRLKAAPGAYSVYCNHGFTLAELLVERVSGQDFTAFLHETLLEPQGLLRTYTPRDSFDRAALAKIYLGDSTRALPNEAVTVIGAGGIYASASDLACFGGLFCDRSTALSKASKDAMAADEAAKGIWPENSGDDAIRYGLGWDSVGCYPFQRAGIKALVKGGDTQFYHSALVVLPEQNMAVGVVSSGGLSTYNELLAIRVLLDALAEQGVEVDAAPGALPAAVPAAMPENFTACSGIYGNSFSVVTLAVAKNGEMTLTVPAALGGGSQKFFYYSDGTFRDESGTIALRLVQEKNGERYLRQTAYTSIPGFAQIASDNYVYQKLPDNPPTEQAMAAWKARSEKLYLVLNEKYTSQSYVTGSLISTMPLLEEVPGYLLAYRIAGEDLAQSVVQIPGVAGRDCQDISFYEKDGLEYCVAQSTLLVDSAGIETIYPGAASRCTILKNGYARWYRIGTAAGNTMTVTTPANGSFTVYEADGNLAANSWALGDHTVLLPDNGWIVFAGEPGAAFRISMK